MVQVTSAVNTTETNRTNEAVLLSRAAAGDQAALERLFTRNTQVLYLKALRILGNSEDARDALQDGLFAAFRNLRTFEGRSQFSTWLTRIVVNAALMRHRRRRLRPEIPLDESRDSNQGSLAETLADVAPNPEELCNHSELDQRLREHLAHLSPALRDSYELCDLAGLTLKQTARILGISEAAAKSRLWRARQKLAQLLYTHCSPCPGERDPVSLANHLPMARIYEDSSFGERVKCAHQ